MSSHGGKRHGSGRGLFPLGYFFTNARDREAEYLSKWQRSSKKAYLDQKVRELGDACVYDICTIFTLGLELRRRENTYKGNGYSFENDSQWKYFSLTKRFSGQFEVTV